MRRWATVVLLLTALYAADCASPDVALQHPPDVRALLAERNATASAMTNATTSKATTIAPATIMATTIKAANLATTAKKTTTQWCVDGGFTFDLNFAKAFADIPAFGNYFVSQWSASLPSQYEVQFRDLAPSPRDNTKPFVIFSVCAPATTSSEQWLVSVQKHIPVLYTVVALPLSADQDEAIGRLRVYHRSAKTAPASIDLTPVRSVVALVSPASNGVPSFESTLIAHNSGGTPATVYAIVCYDMRDWRDTAIALPEPIVLQPKHKASLTFRGPLIPNAGVNPNLVASDLLISLHLVQSSGSSVETTVTAALDAPETMNEATLPPTSAPDAKHGKDALVALDAQPKAADEDEFARVRNRLHSQGVIANSAFPSSTFKAISACLVLGVVVYTSYFAYARLRNRSMAWTQLVGRKKQKAQYPNDNIQDSALDEFDDHFEEDDGLLSPTTAPKPPPVLTQETDPQHVWGQQPARVVSPVHREPLFPATTPTKRATTSAVVPEPLELDPSIRIHPKRFESLWGEYMERAKWQRAISLRPDANAVMTRFYDMGLVCMASGSVQLTDKYLFYAAEPSAPDAFYFCDVAIQFISLEVDISVRTPRETSTAKMHAFVQRVKMALDDLDAGASLPTPAPGD
ncbi:hypothetical protein SPRG_05214 [Saprolegnia parasitica CBS 223.65]|uniref:Beta-adaptin appendage C-terminal subdomain domain-containing protein n=1 Tax=Saprolegnia parasitica (strain CBS 223.65) TaxID=695850 RepID=A0A067CGZ5_SAPPC|nr:hypothetical protein SPRG_05214 [Saprolegnia parasitica CBS 223.65]KDO30024.1 hypothetical protein SPRG_05214 [Saprolegnia parasitica CBS 223.65]|eukprot:XP_012199206.1 hypothetical protein SPRG_05214 [Saprolegnia parasitica CBS 223.65]